MFFVVLAHTSFRAMDEMKRLVDKYPGGYEEAYGAQDLV